MARNSYNQQGTAAVFPGPDQDKTGAGEHSKGRKIPKCQTNATTKAKVRCLQLCLTDRIYHPDPHKAGFKCRIGATALAEIRHYQRNFKFLMAVHPFIRLVWEILDDARITVFCNGGGFLSVKDAFSETGYPAFYR